MKKAVVGGQAGEESSGGGQTVVVGVKLDGPSRELLTWALVKVAQPGDHVIALHVLNNNETADRDGKSPLQLLVKAFDSILDVYEGFCNLKQIDLKLKISRGAPVQNILVREAKSFNATVLIVGTARNHHTIRSSTSVAKYCAKKLGNDCSILAVDNGKILFHGGASSESHHHRRGLLNTIQKTFSKNCKVIGDVTLDIALVKNNSESAESALKQNCSICLSNLASLGDSGVRSVEKSSTDDNENNSMSIISVQNQEDESSSLTLLIKESPELKPGWPLLHRAILVNRQASSNSLTGPISTAEWAIRLPNRQTLLIKDLDENGRGFSRVKEEFSELYGQNGAIVPVGIQTISAAFSSHCTSRDLPKELEGLHEKYSATCRLFKYEELFLATSSFMPGNLIGKGGNSQVYRGCLPDGKEVAVKILNPSEGAVKDFVSEIEIITTLHHKNIVSLFGFCHEGNRLLLVYDFLSRGSLEENLHGTMKDPLLFGWSERYKVAVGVAEALEYLHNRKAQPVIHRDVKSSNILLSDDFDPQISDFGLAKWASTISSHITCTEVAGTFGYLAPEYFMYGKVNEKIDVYAFGVVLLELLSGRKPISNGYPKGEESLVIWAKPFLSSGKFIQLLDPTLDSYYDYEQIERMVLAAALCIRRAPRARPKMSVVLKLLQGETEVIKWARLQVNAFVGYQTQPNIAASETSDAVDEEPLSHSNLQCHLNLAMQDVEEDSISICSIEQTVHVSLEDYLRGRLSHSSSFD